MMKGIEAASINAFHFKVFFVLRFTLYVLRLNRSAIDLFSDLAMMSAVDKINNET